MTFALSGSKRSHRTKREREKTLGLLKILSYHFRNTDRERKTEGEREIPCARTQIWTLIAQLKQGFQLLRKPVIET